MSAKELVDRYEYVLLTKDDLPWDGLRAWPSGPATVTVDGWAVSYTHRRYPDGMWVLNVRRAGNPDERHPLDGTRYALEADATRAAYEAGLLARMVYLVEAEELGVAELVARKLCPGCGSSRTAGPDHEGVMDCVECGEAWEVGQ